MTTEFNHRHSQGGEGFFGFSLRTTPREGERRDFSAWKINGFIFQCQTSILNVAVRFFMPTEELKVTRFRLLSRKSQRLLIFTHSSLDMSSYESEILPFFV
jgi:hypothetical protein